MWYVAGSHSNVWSVDIVQPHPEGKHESGRFGRYNFIAKNLGSKELAQTIVDAHNASLKG